MYRLSARSKQVLKKTDPRLQWIIEEAITLSPVDFGIPSDGGRRTAEEQHLLFKAGKSKCDGYKRTSKHQRGEAVDVYAYVNGKASWSVANLCLIAGVILSVAAKQGVKLRWGGNWDGDGEIITDQRFQDLPHFELTN